MKEQEERRAASHKACWETHTDRGREVSQRNGGAPCFIPPELRQESRKEQQGGRNRRSLWKISGRNNREDFGGKKGEKKNITRMEERSTSRETALAPPAHMSVWTWAWTELLRDAVRDWVWKGGVLVCSWWMCVCTNSGCFLKVTRSRWEPGLF